MMTSYLPSVDFITGSLVVGIVLIGIRAYLNKRHLYLIVPKQFAHSELSDGQVVVLTIVNSGKRTEEDITVRLNPKLHYDTITASYPCLTVDSNGKIKIERLSKAESISMILNVDGGEFNVDCVLSINSKEVEGGIKKDYKETHELKPQEVVIMVLVLFGLIPALGYFIGTSVEDYFSLEAHSLTKAELIDSKAKEQAAKTLTAQGWEGIESFMYSEYYELYSDSWIAHVSQPTRDGNILSWEVQLDNKVDSRMIFSVRASTPNDPKRRERTSEERSLRFFHHDILVLPDTSDIRIFESYIPEDIEKKYVIFNFMLNIKSDMYTFEYVWNGD